MVIWRIWRLFKVNTGTREQEVVQLRWDWEVKLPEVNKSVFVIPASVVKNKADRVVILNDVAQSVSNRCGASTRRMCSRTKVMR